VARCARSPSLADSATADAPCVICDLNLSELQGIEPPRGFGRDAALHFAPDLCTEKALIDQQDFS